MRVWFPIIRANSGSDIFTIRLAESLKKHGIDTIVTWSPWYFEFFPFLLYFKNVSDIDLVHTNSWNGFAFKRKGIPLIVTAHHSVLDPSLTKYKSHLQRIYHNTLIRLYETLSFKSSNAVTTVSQYSASIFQSRFHIEDIEIIYNFLDTDLFTPSYNIWNDTSANRTFRLLFIGGLSYRKGVDMLGPILEKLGSEYELLVISNDSDRNNHINSSCDNIRYVGPKTNDDIILAYQDCDAVLFPTRLEGFGLVALESMACGKPVITSRNSSLPEIIEHQVSGLLCQTDDIDEYVNACKLLRSNSDLYNSISKASRERACSLFAEDKIISEYIDLYRRVTESSARQ